MYRLSIGTDLEKWKQGLGELWRGRVMVVMVAGDFGYLSQEHCLAYCCEFCDNLVIGLL